MTEKISSREGYLWLSFFILVLIIHSLFAYTGHFGYADMTYARMANDLYTGDSIDVDNYGKPWPLLIFTGLFYIIFGVSDFATILSSLVVSSLILAVVFSILKTSSRITLVTALAITTFSNWWLFYSNKLVPDIYVALAVIFILYLIYRYKYTQSRRGPVFSGLLIAIALLIGFSARNTMIIFFPLLIYFAVADIIQKRDQQLWLYTGIFSVILLGLFFILTTYIPGREWGSTFFASKYTDACNYTEQSSDALAARLLYRYFEMMLIQGMLVGLGIIIAFLVTLKDRQFFLFENPKGFFSFSAIFLLISANLMTVSFKGYVPMCTDPLYFLFIIPVAAPAAGMFLHEFYLDRKKGLLLAGIFLIFGAVSLLLSGAAWFRDYFPMMVFALIFTFLPEKNKTQGLFIVLFLLVTGMNLVSKFSYADNVKYHQQKEIVSTNFIDTEKPAYVITDKVQKRIADYYSGFNPNHPVQFLAFNTFSFDTLNNDKPLYLLNNWHTAYHAGLEKKGLPYFARVIDPSSETVLDNDDPNIKIFRLNNIVIPELTFESKHGFEEENPQWRQEKNDVFKFNAASGDFSYRVKEFSATFEAPLKKVNPDSTASKLLIKALVQARSPKPSDARLVISVQADTANLAYESARLDEFIHTYGDWWLCSHEMIFDLRKNKPNARIKIYVHNPDKVNLYVDDFDVKVYEIKD